MRVLPAADPRAGRQRGGGLEAGSSVPWRGLGPQTATRRSGVNQCLVNNVFLKTPRNGMNRVRIGGGYQSRMLSCRSCARMYPPTAPATLHASRPVLRLESTNVTQAQISRRSGPPRRSLYFAAAVSASGGWRCRLPGRVCSWIVISTEVDCGGRAGSDLGARPGAIRPEGDRRQLRTMIGAAPSVSRFDCITNITASETRSVASLLLFVFRWSDSPPIPTTLLRPAHHNVHTARCAAGEEDPTVSSARRRASQPLRSWRSCARPYTSWKIPSTNAIISPTSRGPF
ncbi:hypothetical protein DFH09DRAFT_46848 [Mycena vulgaris]|nr:hypothetical protein DFH09DRAFT_46848 [Mycena vulgaris]